MMNSWSILRASYAAADIQNADEVLNQGQVEIPSSMLEVNVYGTAVEYNPGRLLLLYTTDNVDSCESIKIGVDNMNMLGVSSSACDSRWLLTISLN